MNNVLNKRILSLTVKDLCKHSVDEILLMLKMNLSELTTDNLDYSISIASAIVSKIMAIRNIDYKKFYEILVSREFRKNSFIYDSLDRMNLSSIRELFDVYEKNDLSILVDSIFKDNEKIFNEIIFIDDYNVEHVFALNVVEKFNYSSYRTMINFILQDDSKSRVIRALFKSKNNKFIYMVSKMDDAVLKYTDDDTEYFNTVLTLLNFNNYRRLLWDYYNKFIKNEDNEYELSKREHFKEVPDELKELINYSYSLMNVKYSNDSIPNIIPDVNTLFRSFKEGKDFVHIAVFGVVGYEKVKNGTFDPLLDFNVLENENQLLNLKIAFFSTVYGLTYMQAEKLVNNFNNFMDEYSVQFDERDSMIYDTIIAIKNLYNLTLDDKSEINLYRDNYYKFLVEHGIYGTVEICSLNIMEYLLKRLYENSIEMI